MFIACEMRLQTPGSSTNIFQDNSPGLRPRASYIGEKFTSTLNYHLISILKETLVFFLGAPGLPSNVLRRVQRSGKPPKSPLGSLLARKHFGFGRSKSIFVFDIDPVLTMFLKFLFSSPILTTCLVIFLSIFHQFSKPLDPQQSCWRLGKTPILTFSAFFFREHFSSPKITPKWSPK